MRTTAKWLRLWPQDVELEPRKLAITGGEPVLREDLLEILPGLRAVYRRRAVTDCLNTNGELLSPELATRLREVVDEVARHLASGADLDGGPRI